MTKMRPEPERESDRYPLTVEQARDLTFGVMFNNLADQEVIGDSPLRKGSHSCFLTLSRCSSSQQRSRA